MLTLLPKVITRRQLRPTAQARAKTLGLSRSGAGVIHHVFSFGRARRTYRAAVDAGTQHRCKKYSVEPRIAAQTGDFTGSGAGYAKRVGCVHSPHDSTGNGSNLAIFGRVCCRFAGAERPHEIKQVVVRGYLHAPFSRHVPLCVHTNVLPDSLSAGVSTLVQPPAA